MIQQQEQGTKPSEFANSPAALGTPGAAGTLPAPLEREIRRIYERSPVYTANWRFPAAALIREPPPRRASTGGARIHLAPVPAEP